MINRAPRRDAIRQLEARLSRSLGQGEHPLSNYGTLVGFLPDRTCRNGRGAINSTTIRQFCSIIRKSAQFVLSVQRW